MEMLRSDGILLRIQNKETLRLVKQYNKLLVLTTCPHRMHIFILIIPLIRFVSVQCDDDMITEPINNYFRD